MRRLLVALVALMFVFTGAGTAAAEPPVEVSGQITDKAGVLGDGAAAVQKAMDELEASTGVQLYAVFVSSFDNEGDTGWMEQTARLSALGDTDVALAVAVANDGTYQYEWWIDDGFELSAAEVEGLVDSAVGAQLDAGNWGAAVINLAEDLRTETDSGAVDDEGEAPAWTTRTTVLVVVVLAVVLLAGHLLSRRKAAAGSS